MRRARFLLPSLFVVLCAWAAPAAVAADAVPTEMDPVKAARAVKLAEKLRCLVCQNQTIADSNAELANDLRSQIREQIAAGKTDDEILAYMVERYGDFVLYQPPFKPTTILLWGGPALLRRRRRVRPRCATCAGGTQAADAAVRLTSASAPGACSTATTGRDSA